MSSVAAPKSPSVWEDFVDIFTSPSAVFERRASAGFGIPLLVLAVVLVVLFLGTKPLLQPIFDAEFARGAAQAMKQNPQVTAEQMEKMRGMSEKFGVIAFAVVVPVRIILVGLVLWLVGKLFDSRLTANSSFTVTTYASFPMILAMVAAGVIGYLADPARLTHRYMATLGLGRLLTADQAAHLPGALLGRVDVFTIWVTVLLGVGLHVVGKVPRGKAAAGAVIVWIVGALPAIFSALRAA